MNGRHRFLAWVAALCLLLIVVDDPGAPPVWTRYYEVDTDRPFFCNRDGSKVYSLAEVHQERRTGYAWYTGAPQRLILAEYPAWKANHQARDIPPELR